MAAMCLGVPGKIVEVAVERGLRMGRVDFGGALRTVCLEYLPDAAPGEWVLVHVGFALSRIDEAEAMRIFELFRELDALGEGGATGTSTSTATPPPCAQPPRACTPRPRARG